jgi:hypothetical protein
MDCWYAYDPARNIRLIPGRGDGNSYSRREFVWGSSSSLQCFGAKSGSFRLDSKLDRCAKLEVLSPGGWHANNHKQGNFLWAPPPAATDAAVEQLCEAVHKRPQCTHVFIAPFLMTNRWRKQMLKATDLNFFLKPECHIWDSSNHEPLGFFIYLPLFRHEPWRKRYTAPVVELVISL